VMQLNAEDAGTRRHIAVQWPEKVAPGTKAATAGFDTIDQLGRMRIQASAEQIRNQSNATIDYGFRLFRLEKPSEKTLDQLQSFDPNEDGVMLAGDFVSKFASHGTPGDQVALSTWLVQDGFGLTPEVNDVGLNDYKLKVCEDSAYVIEPGLDSDDVMALVTKLEAGELDLKRLVVFGYSVPFSVMHELKQNLTSLRSGQSVSVIERY
jgi:adenine-specific DNA-methyltransferase